MVRTKADDVLDRIRAVVRRPQRSDMGSFRIGSARCLQSQAADLAAVVMKAFNLVCDLGVTDDPLNGHRAARRRCLHGSQGFGRNDPGGGRRVFSDEPVPPYEETRTSLLVPVALNIEQTIVAETSGWGESGLQPCPPDNAHRKAVPTAYGES